MFMHQELEDVGFTGSLLKQGGCSMARCTGGAAGQDAGALDVCNMRQAYHLCPKSAWTHDMLQAGTPEGLPRI
eukprot:1155283-Pelagomonas_calceolata.AAC.6